MSRTVIDLNDNLIRKAGRLTGLTKKADILNLALEYLIREREFEELPTSKTKNRIRR